MEFLQPYLNYIYIAAGILALLVLAWIAMRLFGRSVRGRKGSRLGISEYYEIDKSRRLVLVRRDDTEHLVLIGGGQDVVVEANIGGNDVGVQQPLPPRDAPVIRPAPRPAVFTGRRPTLRPVDNGDLRGPREEPTA